MTSNRARSGIFRSSHRWSFSFEFTQHIPPKGSHLIRYYGWYSNKSRGVRNKAAAQAAVDLSATAAAEGESRSGSSQSWAMLIKRVYEVDPLSCVRMWWPDGRGGLPRGIGTTSRIEPPQDEVIEKILRHCGLWRSSAARAPPANPWRGGMDRSGRSDSEPKELIYVDIDTFLANF